MSKEKTRIHTWLSPETEQKLKAAFPLANCKSQNEFVEKAISFYSDYIMTQEATDFLAPMLVSALRSTVQTSENRIARLLFKQAVSLVFILCTPGAQAGSVCFPWCFSASIFIL